MLIVEKFNLTAFESLPPIADVNYEWLGVKWQSQAKSNLYSFLNIRADKFS